MHRYLNTSELPERLQRYVVETKIGSGMFWVSLRVDRISKNRRTPHAQASCSLPSTKYDTHCVTAWKKFILKESNASILKVTPTD